MRSQDSQRSPTLSSTGEPDAAPRRSPKPGASPADAAPGPQRRGRRAADQPAPEPAEPAASIGTILEQWSRERPDLDPRPMELFGVLARAEMLTTQRFNATLERWGLSRGGFDVLAALRRAGAPYTLTPTQLSRSLMLSGAGMTSRLDRLEKLGLIERLPEPADGRRLRIKMTRSGVRLIDAAVPDLLQTQADIVAALGAAASTAATQSLRRLVQVLSTANL